MERAGRWRQILHSQTGKHPIVMTLELSCMTPSIQFDTWFWFSFSPLSKNVFFLKTLVIWLLLVLVKKTSFYLRNLVHFSWLCSKHSEATATAETLIIERWQKMRRKRWEWHATKVTFHSWYLNIYATVEPLDVYHGYRCSSVVIWKGTICLFLPDCKCCNSVMSLCSVVIQHT